MVNVYRSELCLLLLAVGGQISPAVVCPHKLGILTGNSVRPFHVVVDMGKGIGHLIVIVPIGHDGEKRLRRRIVREIVADQAFHGKPPVVAVLAEYLLGVPCRRRNAFSRDAHHYHFGGCQRRPVLRFPCLLRFFRGAHRWRGHFRPCAQEL